LFYSMKFQNETNLSFQRLKDKKEANEKSEDDETTN